MAGRLRTLGIVAAGVLVGGVVTAVLWHDRSQIDPEPLVCAAPEPAEPVRVTQQTTLASGETLSAVVARLGMGAREATEWFAQAGRHLDLRALPVGLQAEAVLDEEGSVLQLRLTPDWRADVILERQGTAIVGRREPRPVERELRVVRGTIASSLFEAVSAAGETDDLALALADLFQWDLDFHREVQPGDTFSVLCERLQADGRTVGYSPIVAASYTGSGRTFTAFRFAPDGAPPGYYDAQGRALRKLFLRAPLKLSRITSRFSKSRMHPVLGKRLPHWGVDYGAPVGTPVMVTAGGSVSFAGVRGGGGKTVEVRHAGGYVTAYLHLSRYAAGIRPGARVEQGQIIGYVGSTGLSTGPHLDYRVTQGGRYINPLTLGRDPSPPLPEAELPRFEAWVERVRPLLDAHEPAASELLAAVANAAAEPFS